VIVLATLVILHLAGRLSRGRDSDADLVLRCRSQIDVAEITNAPCRALNKADGSKMLCLQLGEGRLWSHYLVPIPDGIHPTDNGPVWMSYNEARGLPPLFVVGEAARCVVALFTVADVK
jgi:uncharacterized protein (DUF983 family)